MNLPAFVPDDVPESQYVRDMRRLADLRHHAQTVGINSMERREVRHACERYGVTVEEWRDGYFPAESDMLEVRR